MTDTYEADIEAKATRDSGYTHTEYIVTCEEMKDDPLIYSEEHYDLAQDVYFDACKVARYDNDTVLAELKLIKREYFAGVPQDTILLTNT